MEIISLRSHSRKNRGPSWARRANLMRFDPYGLAGQRCAWSKVPRLFWVVR
jgi:hypothetical protein